MKYANILRRYWEDHQRSCWCHLEPSHYHRTTRLRRYLHPPIAANQSWPDRPQDQSRQNLSANFIFSSCKAPVPYKTLSSSRETLSSSRETSQINIIITHSRLACHTILSHHDKYYIFTILFFRDFILFPFLLHTFCPRVLRSLRQNSFAAGICEPCGKTSTSKPCGKRCRRVFKIPRQTLIKRSIAAG